MDTPIELLDLIEFEKKVQDLYVNKNINGVFLFPDNLKPPILIRDILNQRVRLKFDNFEIQFIINRPLIHQIGDRLWPKVDDYNLILRYWIEEMNKGIESFAKKIFETIQNNNLVIRYFNQNDKNIGYGIVSNVYKPTNQIEFRERFVNEALNREILESTSTQIKKREINIEEIFLFKRENFSIDFRCSIIYGKNTGYNAYKVRWYRKTIEDNLWLTPWESESKYMWKNNSHSDIKEFVDYLIFEAEKHDKFIKDCLEKAKYYDLTDDFVDFFLNKRMFIAYATKDKIKEYYYANQNKYGKTIWSFSHALRYFGSESNHISKNTKQLLIETGTYAIEKRFDGFLELDTIIELKGDYKYQ